MCEDIFGLTMLRLLLLLLLLFERADWNSIRFESLSVEFEFMSYRANCWLPPAVIAPTLLLLLFRNDGI